MTIKNRIFLSLLILGALHSGLIVWLTSTHKFSRISVPQAPSLTQVFFVAPKPPAPIKPETRPVPAPTLTPASKTVVPATPKRIAPVKTAQTTPRKAPQPTTESAPLPASAVSTALSSPAVSMPEIDSQMRFDYLTAVIAKIERNKFYPTSAKSRRHQGRVTLGFTILPDGKVADVRISESSGYRQLDAAAKQAVSLAAPFDPFSARIAVGQFNIIQGFDFRLQ